MTTYVLAPGAVSQLQRFAEAMRGRVVVDRATAARVVAAVRQAWEAVRAWAVRVWEAIRPGLVAAYWQVVRYQRIRRAGQRRMHTAYSRRRGRGRR